MPRDTATAAAKNKRIRQEALREQLQAQGHVQHVVDLVGKIQDETQPIEADILNRYKIVLDAKFKLIDKYLPSLKQADYNIGGQDDNPLKAKWEVEVVHTDAKDSDSS